MGYGHFDETPDGVEVEPYNGLFYVPAFFIMLRETLEAAIIISVLLGLLDQVNAPQYKRFVWLGVLSACILCIAIAVIVLIIINVLKNEFMDDLDTRLKTEGSLAIIASILIGYVALSMGNMMAKYGKYKDRLERQLEEERQSEGGVSWQSMFFLAFTAVVREGIETIIFFSGISASAEPRSLPLAAIVGAVAGVVIGVALYRFGGQLTINWFFKFSMVLLVFIGAGMFTVGINYFQIVGNFGTWSPEEDRPPMNQKLWDISECCGLDNDGWLLFRVLLGYTPYPTGWEVFFYFMYHIVTWSLAYARYQNQLRKDAGQPTYKENIKAFLFTKVFCCWKPKETQTEPKYAEEEPKQQAQTTTTEEVEQAKTITTI